MDKLCIQKQKQSYPIKLSSVLGYTIVSLQVYLDIAIISFVTNFGSINTDEVRLLTTSSKSNQSTKSK